MTRDEFLSLPPRLALAQLWDALKLDDVLGRVEAPKPPRSPKYDLRMYRKGGHCWASEMTLDSLQFWHQLAVESSQSGSQYAEKDAKKAKNLERWIAWREVEPDAVWQGERDDRATTAAAPSRNPDIHVRDGGSSGGSYDQGPPGDDLPF